MVDLGTHWFTPAGVVVQWDGARTPLGRDLAAGQSVTLNAMVEAPATAASYILKWDLSFEGISWFSDKGTPPGVSAVTVKAPPYAATNQPPPLGADPASA